RDFHVTGVQTCALPIFGHPVEADRDQHAEIGVGRQFGGAVGGDVAIVDQVALGRGVVLDHAEGDVVVGQHQAVGGDEGTGAATGAHHGIERGGGEVGQLRRVAGVTGAAHGLGQLR